MNLSSSQLLSFTQSLQANGASDPHTAVRNLLVALTEGGCAPFCWKDTLQVLEGVYGKDLPRSYAQAFNALIRSAEKRGYYYFKDSPVGKDSPERAPAPPRAPRTGKPEGLSWAPSFIAPNQERESWYGEDAGLRRLALGQVKCFASYSEQDRACGQCPLARFCQEASFAKMEELARLLDTQEEARIIRETEALNAPAPAPSVTPEAPVAPSVAPSVTPAPSSGTIQDVLADLQSRGMTASSPPMPFKGVCSGCSGSVEAGSTVIHVKGRGMFHPVCAQKI